MPEISYRTNHIKLNYPNKVLSCSVSSQAGTQYWPHANGTNDPWYESSASKKYYRWEITFSVTEQTHGSHLTREEKKYNGLDIVVGDWIAGASSGQCLKIISISAKTKNSVTAVVEDMLRYNTFKSTTGNGIFSNGSAVVFSLNENGLPLLDPLPGIVSTDFYATVVSRFQYLNPQLNFLLEKEAHGFTQGDVIAVTNAGFVKANTNTMDRMVGTVIDAGPGPDFFIISPNNRIIDFDPNIPGTQGDYIYVQDDGTLSTAETGIAAFLNIQDAIPTELVGTVDGPEVPSSHSIKLNGHIVTISGAGSNANVAEIATAINSDTANHKVIASTIATPTTVTSDTSAVAYGLIGGFAPFSAYIDSGSGNTLVNFTTTTAGQAAYGAPVTIAEDMASDISSAGIANLVATFAADTNLLTLTEVNGNAISITSNTNDTNNNPFVGVSNISGLPATVSAQGTEKLKLSRNDGGEILIFESTEFFRTGTGISSGHTGQYPLAINIEQGLRRAGTTVVANISVRDALTAESGDQAYVLNKGDGEWGLYVYNGSSWTMVANEDSATTDAKTLTTTFTMPASGFGVATTQLLGNVSPGRRLLNVTVDVTTAFTGQSSIPNIQVGTLIDPDAYVPATSNDLSDQTQFEYSPNYIYPSTETQDLEVRARCTHNGASAGVVTVKLTYV